MEKVVVNEVENVAEAQVEVNEVENVAEAQVEVNEVNAIHCQVVRVSIENFDDEDTIRIVVNRPLSGFKKLDDGRFTHTEVDYVRFKQAALTAQLCRVSPEFATYRSLQKERLSHKQLAVMLAQAKLVLAQRLVVAGEVLDDNGTVKDHDVYITDIKAVQFNKQVSNVFASLTERVLFGALGL